MQPHGDADLVEDEIAVGLAIGRGETLGSARDFDRIPVHDADFLKEFAEAGFESVIEAPHDGRVAHIPIARRIEMEDLFHRWAPETIVSG
jgi:hypothetical protein